MTRDRKRKLKIRAEMAALGLSYDEAAVVVDSRGEPAAGSPPPAEVPMADDPLGLSEGTELFTAPLLVVTMLPPGPEGLEAAQVIADSVDYLVDPNAGWYRGRAEVWGPRPTQESGMAPLAGHRPGMLLAQVTARRRWTTQTLHDFLRHAATAILAALATRYPPITDRHVTVQALTMETASQILTGEAQPTAQTAKAHASLRGAVAQDGGEADEMPDDAPYPFRVVDARDCGWYAVGRALYLSTASAQRGDEPTPLDELEAERGPLRAVVPAPAEDLDQLRSAFLDAGPKAVASLLVALYRLARHHAELEYERSGVMRSGRLYAGGEDTWETVAMRSLTWGLGVDLADKPKRLHEPLIEIVRTVVDAWVSPDSPAYIEVANNLASAFQAAERKAGGWQALADAYFQPGARFAHSTNSVEAAHAWLLGQPPALEGT
ncbi:MULTISPECIES: hypothetical protein [unclassified Streptomyces]|uniref:hypothetical protein n=1 Tax=unclassified Streptomyces TaxID=2593676 RepID=UPI002365DCD3|nr:MULTISPECIES: hypothetical protein [unclassified Streptomyces]MDF3141075.1 hypothetical protein [Streptomyces sp. T21Q-yed]WDF45060.1 hypothetical protein PBV52_51080 [Streptomyces sp. T12]